MTPEELTIEQELAGIIESVGFDNFEETDAELAERIAKAIISSGLVIPVATLDGITKELCIIDNNINSMGVVLNMRNDYLPLEKQMEEIIGVSRLLQEGMRKNFLLVEGAIDAIKQEARKV